MRDLPGVTLGNNFNRVLAGLSSVKLSTQDSAIKMKRRQRFQWPFQPQIKVLQILPDNDEVDPLRMGERTAETFHVAAGPDIGVSSLTPAQIADRGGLAGGRTEQSGVGCINRRACGFVGFATHPSLARR